MKKTKPTPPRAESVHYDVLIVGAGLSGICAAYHLQKTQPHKRYAILESRDSLGGTWDLFRYPGVRSDSDMYTLGYAFRPWNGTQALADGATIRDYLHATAAEFGIDRHIRYEHRVNSADWDSAQARWTLTVAGPDHRLQQLSCHFLFLCSGYYDYAQGYTPELPGLQEYRGRVVHPQQWDESLDYSGQRVVVIGSGATAVTLVPAMAQRAAHVTMLQRSPTYVVSLPRRDTFADFSRRWLPPSWAYQAIRWRSIVLASAFYSLSRRYPEFVKRQIRKGLRAQLGADYDIATHFTPRYQPWDERMCMVPDGDLFKALRSGRASVVTDHIATLTASGIRLQSGAELQADLIVTATGLQLQAFGGMQLSVDGRVVDLAQTVSYKGLMLSDIPNMAYIVGYTNASWTLKADLACAYVCRLLQHLDRHALQACVPRLGDTALEREPLLDFASGYVKRAIDRFPRAGSKAPWKLRQNYLLDRLTLKHGAIDDGVLQFQPRRRPAAHGGARRQRQTATSDR